MSLEELKKQSDANEIVKAELLKLKKSQVTNPILQTDLIVDANLQLDDINEAKRILKKNLASLMPVDVIDEIVNDNSIVDDSNIQLINEKWKDFMRRLKDGTTRLSLDRFKIVFKDFIDKITNPVNEQQLNKLQYIEQALRDIAMEQSNYAPKIEKIINSLDEQNLSIENINDILDIMNSDDVDLNEIEDIVKPVDSSPPERLDMANFPSWSLNDVNVDSRRLISDYGNDYRGKITPWKNKLKELLQNSPPQDVQDALRKLSDEEQKAYLKLIKELSKPRERKQVKHIVIDLDPVVMEYRNNKIQDYMTTGFSPDEAKAKSLVDSKATFGYGMKNKSNVVPFGVLMLNIDKLHNESKLKLTYKNGNMVKEIKLTAVSDSYIDMVNDILQGKKFNERKFKMLPEDEKYLYKMMLKKSKLAGEIDVRLDNLTSSEIEKLKNEWAVVFGEINAGNNSRELHKRAKELINIFITKRMISKSEGLKMLTNL